MELIQQIGAVVGLASFLGLAVLSFLYFAQARHVRDLEEKATYLPEDLELPVAVPEEEPAVAETDAPEPATEAQSQAQLQAARQVEMARAAAERRARFEQRRRPGWREPGQAGRRMPEPRALAVIIAGVALLAVGVVFGAGQLLGGDDDGGSEATAPATPGGNPAEDITVAVLNGTPVPGAAANFGQEIRNTFKLGPVTNTEIPFEASLVMFDQAQPTANADAQTVAGQLGITKVEPMSSDVKKASEGAPVAFIVGEDRAGTPEQ